MIRLRWLLNVGIIFLLVMWNQISSAGVKHELFTKIAVFPIADDQFSKKSTNTEEAWWQVRESLTRGQKFLVASRRFMINRGVFQPRKNLKPADTVILAKLLDAEALVTTFLSDRKLTMTVYNGYDGSTLWRSELDLHPAIPIQEQIVKASQKMIQDFLNILPYHSYQVQDDNRTQLVVDDGEKVIANVAKISGLDLKVGDTVEWVDVESDPGEPFFNQSFRVTTLAEGKIISIRDQVLDVQVLKLRSKDDLKERSLVRFPKEIFKAQSSVQNSLAGGQTADISPEYLNSELKDARDLEKGHNATTTALAFFGNIALMVLIAF